MSSPDFTHFNPLAQGGWISKLGAGTSQDVKKLRTPRPATSDCDRIPLQPTYGALPLSTALGSQSITTPQTGSTTFRFVPSPNNYTRYINCSIIGPHNREMYRVISNDRRFTTVQDSVMDHVATIEWCASSPTTDVRGGGGKKRRDEWLNSVPGAALPVQCMWWNTLPYYWTADNVHIYLYAEKMMGLPLAIVRASGPLFEIEVSPEILQRGILEPALVALMLIQWSRGSM